MMLAVTIMLIMTLKIVNTCRAVIWCKIPVNCAVHVGEIQLAPTQISLTYRFCPREHHGTMGGFTGGVRGGGLNPS